MAATTPARKRAPRKTTSSKPTPADAAAAEAVNADGDVTVDFRGEKFTITREARQSWRAMMALGNGNVPRWFGEVITNPIDQERLIGIGRRGETFAEVSQEFFAAFAEASGEGNS